MDEKRKPGLGFTRATPEQAKAIWESMAKPTQKKVWKAMMASGTPVNPSTIGKWKNNGWTRKKDNKPDTAFDLAKEQIDTFVPVLTGDGTTRLADFVPVFLDELTDEDLMREQMRFGARTTIILNREIQRKSAFLEQLDLKGLAALIHALGAMIEATWGNEQRISDKRSRDMKTLDGSVVSNAAKKEMEELGI